MLAPRDSRRLLSSLLLVPLVCGLARAQTVIAPQRVQIAPQGPVTPHRTAPRALERPSLPPAAPGYSVPGRAHDLGLRVHSGEAAAAGGQDSPDHAGLVGLHLHSGEVRVRAVDLYLKGVGFDFAWVREYRSGHGRDTEQGNGWDHAYDLSVRRVGTALELSSGNHRRDLFVLNSRGRYETREYLITGVLRTDQRIVFAFPDRSNWVFRPLDAQTAPGRIEKIDDRNGNEMGFVYDTLGRLSTIRDTRGQDIAIGYLPSGHIGSVTDPGGRKVTYTYDDGQGGGNAGDLLTVTSPSVTDPRGRGNEFPKGKVVRYRYTRGRAEPRLNSNLVAVVDGLQRQFVAFRYATTTNPWDIDFDRVVERLQGDIGSSIGIGFRQFVYVPVLPTPENNGAVTRVIDNDEVGNVGEHFFDERNLLVLRRRYTGRAVPTRRTTATANRPQNPLRPGDPVSFDTRYAYNDDALLTEIRYPGGNFLNFAYWGEGNPQLVARLRGNIRSIVRRRGSLPGDQISIAERFEYVAGFGNWLGTRFATQRTDGRQKIWKAAFDSRGNRTAVTTPIAGVQEDWAYDARGRVTEHVWPDNGQKHRRRDAFVYATTGPAEGFLREVMVDADGRKLKTTFERDGRGNLTKVTNPDGFDTQLVVNELDQVLRVESREVSAAVKKRYHTDYSYDANDRRYLVDRLNLDELGDPRSNDYLYAVFEFDVLGNTVKYHREVDLGKASTEEYQYTAAGELALIRYGEAVRGGRPANVVALEMDERGLPFRRIAGQGGNSQSTTQYDYDANGMQSRVTLGLESSNPVSHTSAFDGYFRPIRRTDAMGNEVRLRYDANGNIVSQRVEGEVEDVPGNANNVRLLEVGRTFDDMNRLLRREHAFFELATQKPLGSGKLVTSYTYTPHSRIATITDPCRGTTTVDWDSAWPAVAKATDAMQNSVAFGYDADGLVTRRTEVDKSGLSSPDRTLVTRIERDRLGRPVAMVDNLNHRTAWAWDSLDNLVVRTDPTGARVEVDHDGLGRPTVRLRSRYTKARHQLDQLLRAKFTWDDSSALREVTEQVRGQSDTTSFTPDDLGRIRVTRHPNTAQSTTTFDVFGNATQTRDPNGTTVTTTFDALGRPLRRLVTPGGDTTFVETAWNGLGELVRARDDDARVDLAYASHGRVLRETLNQRLATGYAFGSCGLVTEVAYPGGRKIGIARDPLGRPTRIFEQTATLADYSYYGPSSVERRGHGNGTMLRMTDDALRRPRSGVVFDSQSRPLDSREYTWDARSRKASERRLVGATSFWHRLKYDHVGDLFTTTKDLPAGPLTVDYLLGEAGKRHSVKGGPDAGQYDAVRRAMRWAYDKTPWELRTVDNAGNVTASGSRTLTYDHRNRVVALVDGARRFRFRYDPLGRRIARIEGADDGGPEDVWYAYAGRRMIEEKRKSGTTVASYVFGAQGDLVQMQRGASGYWLHQNTDGSVVALSDATGALVDSHDYLDFGTPVAPASIPCAYRFRGMVWDRAIGLHQVGGRYPDPRGGDEFGALPGADERIPTALMNDQNTILSAELSEQRRIEQWIEKSWMHAFAKIFAEIKAEADKWLKGQRWPGPADFEVALIPDRRLSNLYTSHYEMGYQEGSELRALDLGIQEGSEFRAARAEELGAYEIDWQATRELMDLAQQLRVGPGPIRINPWGPLTDSVASAATAVIAVTGTEVRGAVGTTLLGGNDPGYFGDPRDTAMPISNLPDIRSGCVKTDKGLFCPPDLRNQPVVPKGHGAVVYVDGVRIN